MAGLDTRSPSEPNARLRCTMDFKTICICCLVMLALVAASDPGARAQQGESADTGHPQSTHQLKADPGATYQWVDLYFGHPSGRHLGVEERRLALPADAAARARTIAEAWIQGPRRKHRVSMVSPETKIRAVYVTPAATAYVDLDLRVGQRHPGGCQTELLTVLGLVNTLTLNMPEISRVKILLGGEEAVTFAGHILLKHPLNADLLLVRE